MNRGTEYTLKEEGISVSTPWKFNVAVIDFHVYAFYFNHVLKNLN